MKASRVLQWVPVSWWFSWHACSRLVGACSSLRSGKGLREPQCSYSCSISDPWLLHLQGRTSEARSSRMASLISATFARLVPGPCMKRQFCESTSAALYPVRS